MKDYLSTKEAAAYLHISVQMARTLIRQKELPAEKTGNLWLIPKDEFYKYYLRQRDSALFAEDFPDIFLQEAQDGSAVPQLNALSFFSGAMGLDQGLEKAGFNIRLACEADKTCQATIKANRPDIPLIGDILNYSADDIRKIAGISGDIDLIAGGPPCQAFSTAGARRGFEDTRGNVFLTYINLLLELRPKYIVIENVRGLLSAALKQPPEENCSSTWIEKNLGKPGGALLYILERLREGGYAVSFNLYNSANFGVPQIRERLVMLCSRDGKKPPYLMPTHDSSGEFDLPQWKTFKEAVQGITGCHHTEFPEKRLKYYRLLGPGQYWKDLPQDLQPEAMGKSFYLQGGKTGFYRRIAWDKPCCTLVTSPTMPATDICHPTENRPLSVEEYKRVQTFPDDWYLAGDIIKQYKQLGNAVPVQMGEIIGKTIIDCIKGKAQVPPKDFKFSRYNRTDEVSWEEDVRKRFGISR